MHNTLGSTYFNFQNTTLRMYKQEREHLKQEYEGMAHPLKLKRSPSGSFRLADSVMNPNTTMNSAQEHNFTFMAHAPSLKNLNCRSQMATQTQTIMKNNVKTELSRLIDNKKNLYDLLEMK